MTLQELRTKNPQELVILLREQRTTLLKLHLQREARELKNVRGMRVSKKMIARMLTLLQGAAKTQYPVGQPYGDSGESSAE